MLALTQDSLDSARLVQDRAGMELPCMSRFCHGPHLQLVKELVRTWVPSQVDHSCDVELVIELLCPATLRRDDVSMPGVFVFPMIPSVACQKQEKDNVTGISDLNLVLTSSLSSLLLPFHCTSGTDG